MSKRIDDIGELRGFLADSMFAVKNGDMKVEVASRVVKLSEQIVKSMYAEAKVNKLQIELGKEAFDFGSMPLRSKKE